MIRLHKQKMEQKLTNQQLYQRANLSDQLFQSSRELNYHLKIKFACVHMQKITSCRKNVTFQVFNLHLERFTKLQINWIC
jgi:hypothetical protein